MLLPREGQIEDEQIFVRWTDGGVHSSIEGNLGLVGKGATGGQGAEKRAKTQADDLTGEYPTKSQSKPASSGESAYDTKREKGKSCSFA